MGSLTPRSSHLSVGSLSPRQRIQPGIGRCRNIVAVILDTDPGIDDAVALALCARTSQIELLAVTASYGNTHALQAWQNARYILENFGAGHVPVFVGSSRPLCRLGQATTETHGEHGLGYADVPDMGNPPDRSGIPAILDVLQTAQSRVKLVGLGPPTTFAAVLAADERLVQSRVSEIVLMGGNAKAEGNVTPVSEFNFWSDPEAASRVLQCGIPVRLVTLDATRRMVMPAEAVAPLYESPDSAHQALLGHMLRFYVEFHQKYEGLNGCILNDPLAIAALIHPESIDWRPYYVQVACEGTLTRGQLLCDWWRRLGERPNAMVSLGVDHEAVFGWILRQVGLSWTINDQDEASEQIDR